MINNLAGKNPRKRKPQKTQNPAESRFSEATRFTLNKSWSTQEKLHSTNPRNITNLNRKKNVKRKLPKEPNQERSTWRVAENN